MADIYYVANIRLPTIKAHGLQVVKTCEALAKAGVDCELIIPKRERYPNTGETDILAYYGVKKNFKITELKSLDLAGVSLGRFLGKILFWIQQYSFLLSLKKYLKRKSGVVYSRDQFAVSGLSSKRFKLYWEVHTLPRKINTFFYKKVFNKLSGLIAISRGLKEDFSRYFSGPILVSPDAVSLENFYLEIKEEDARNKLGLPLDKRLVIYTGHLYKWKGADILLKTAEDFKADDVLFLFVGGTRNDVENFKEKAENRKNVLVLGHQPHQIIPYYLEAADILVLPNLDDEDISRKYTSPLKLFEYMAAGKPIVASDLPSLREILNEENSVFFEPNNSRSLAEKIVLCLNDRILAEKISCRAREDAKNYTWEKRAENIIHFINK